MKKIALLALCAPLVLSACGGSPYRVETRDTVEPPPEVLTQERLDAIIRERQIDMSRSGR
ncbi:hypothetical protein [Aquibium microcysteis]|uniref:hypothetical protein n=1 Tax=Aquibium microcysteis TaxID=675281 RepID=UPI00165D2429|nr:hypothetical protein [Aquibium microcysteis]